MLKTLLIYATTAGGQRVHLYGLRPNQTLTAASDICRAADSVSNADSNSRYVVSVVSQTPLRTDERYAAMRCLTGNVALHRFDVRPQLY